MTGGEGRDLAPRHPGEPAGATGVDLGTAHSMTLAVGFRCNNACPGCLVGPWVNRAPPMSRERFREIIRAHGARPRFERLVLSGAEITLEPDVLDLVRFAREHGGFRAIRLQTNGRRLGDRGFLRALLDAGVDEFYVSVRGHTPELDRELSGNPRSFRQLQEGLAALAETSATLIVNLVASARSVRHLTEMATYTFPYGPRRVEIYNFLPMTEAQTRELVPMEVLGREVRRCLERLEAEGVDAAVSWMPRCILGRFADRHAPPLPETTIEHGFWEVFPSFHCLYHAVCQHAGPCGGLSLPHVRRFGWEQDQLTPTPREDGPAGAAPRRGQGHRPTSPRDWEGLLAGPDGRPIRRTSLWRLEGVELGRRRVDFRFASPGGGFTLRLRPVDGPRKGSLRTAGFSVTLVAPWAASRQRMRLLLTLFPIIERNDDGRFVIFD